jgi:hypothetical protein
VHSCAACGAACKRTSAKFKIINACVKRVSNLKEKGGGEKLVHRSCAACGAACERTSAKFKNYQRLRKAGEQFKRKRGRRKACA